MRSRHFKGCDSPPSAAPPHQLVPLPPTPSQIRAPHTWPSEHPFGVLSPPLTPEHPHRSTKAQSEHVESGPYSYYPQATNEAARRGLMPSSSSPSASPISTRPIHLTFPSLGTSTSTNTNTTTKFTFSILPRPEMLFTFEPRAPPPPRPRKRCRATADVDGEHSTLHKKKRRLRLFLITSRLSPQFSHPATNIVDRGSSKIAVWAKQNASGRNILRKAAILNRVRRQSMCALETAGGLGRVLVEQEKEQEQLQLARLTLLYGSHATPTRPVGRDCASLPQAGETRPGDRTQTHSSGSSLSSASSSASSSPELRAGDDDGTAAAYRSPNDAYVHSHSYPKASRAVHAPLPPSPLGLSNYDALDLEDDIPDPYAHLDEEYEAEERVEDSMDDEDDGDDAAPSRSSYRRGNSSATWDMVVRQSIYADFSVLDPNDPSADSYDADEDAHDTAAIWPTVPHTSTNEAAASLPSPRSPPPRTSSTLFPTTSPPPQPQSPNFASAPLPAVLSPTSASPNFSAVFSTVGQERAGTKEGVELEEERKRQRDLMFMSFGG